MLTCTNVPKSTRHRSIKCTYCSLVHLYYSQCSKRKGTILYITHSGTGISNNSINQECTPLNEVKKKKNLELNIHLTLIEGNGDLVVCTFASHLQGFESHLCAVFACCSHASGVSLGYAGRKTYAVG